MYKNFNLTESEKEEILNNHKEHGYKKPINEQMDGADMMPLKFIFKKLEKQRPNSFRIAVQQGTGAQFIIGKTKTQDNPFVEYHPDYDENEGAKNFVYAYGKFDGKRKEYYHQYGNPSEVSGDELNKIVQFMLDHGPQPVTPQDQQPSAPTQPQKPLNEGQEILKDVFKSLIK
jgi:hypothetical protein